MADTKLADLTALTTPSGDDILYIVDDPAGTPLDRKIALDNLFTRGTITADAPVLNMSQTWNNGAVTFTGLKFNATTGSSAGSAAASLLMDLQLEGTSRFKVSKTGNITALGLFDRNNALNYTYFDTNILYFAISDVAVAAVSSGQFRIRSSDALGFSSGTTNLALDTILTRRAAANLRLGAADTTGTTAPTPQFLSAQSWASSTNNNQTGANFTIDGSQGTGTGAGGSIIFRVAPAGVTSNGVQNALVDALIIQTGTRLKMRSGSVAGNAGSGLFSLDNTAIAFGQDAGGNVWGGITGSGFTVDAAAYYSFGSSGTASPDTILRRDAANTLALRNGANAQKFRVYNTTDGTNSEFGFAQWSSNVFQIGTGVAGTGTNRGINIAAGNGIVNFNSEFAMFNAVLRVTASNSINWSSLDNNINDGFDDTGLSRAAANVLRLTNGSTGGGSLQLTEMTAPAAPATNNVRIYAEDNGSGKTRLMALFPTGAAVQIAIEP